MKFITILLRHKSVIFSLLGFSFFASCGSYQYVGMSEDGIYGPSESVEYNTPAEDSAAENTDGSLVVVVFNEGVQARSFDLEIGGEMTTISIEAQALQTIIKTPKSEA